MNPRPAPDRPPEIHPTAVVSSEAVLANGVTVGPYAVIDGPAEIGPETEIGAHAWVSGRVILGRRNRVFPGAILGAEPQDLSYQPCASSLVVGDHNVFREYCTIHRGTREGSETRVGNRNYFMAHSHAAHNCRIGDDVVVCNNTVLAGYVEVGDRAFLSANVMVHQFTRVGTVAMLSGATRGLKDAPPYTILQGESVVRGLNVVGLRRAGVGSAQRLALRQAYRLLFRSGLIMSDALRKVEEEVEPTEEVRILVDFIRTSRRGVSTARVPRKEEDAP